MKKLILLSVLLIVGLFSQDCIEGVEVKLWDKCYNIENTLSLNVFGNATQLGYHWNLTPTDSLFTIPHEIGHLINLNSIFLPYSNLEGAIPPEIGNLINLTSLNLNSNNLSGEIPIEIGNLINLYDIDLMHNQLEGNIPSEIGNITSLTLLYLGHNQFTEIPPEIGSLTNLAFLDLQDNQFTVFPEELWYLNNNCYIYVINNFICDTFDYYTGGINIPTIVFENSDGVQNTEGCFFNIFNIGMPTKYNIEDPYPNPFNPITNISFSIPKFGFINITVYDINGRELETLTNEVLSIGNYSINWNASSYPSGVYLIRMDSGEFTQTQKVVLVK